VVIVGVRVIYDTGLEKVAFISFIFADKGIFSHIKKCWTDQPVA
jgi:hypothetical protein